MDVLKFFGDDCFESDIVEARDGFVIAHEVGRKGGVAESIDWQSAFPKNSVSPGGTSVFLTGYQSRSKGPQTLYRTQWSRYRIYM